MTRFEPWVRRVAALHAWGRPLEEVRVTFVPEKRAVLGTAWAAERRIEIYDAARRRPDDVVATLLHEFAHCAAPADVRHGLKFKQLLRAATTELTGFDPGIFENYETLQESVCHCVSSWWQMSGVGARWRAAAAFDRLCKK